jgi:hypothetical protein
MPGAGRREQGPLEGAGRESNRAKERGAIL